jgi:methylated-DNA-[protein]-cysteine S-methyltransferase
MASLKLNNAPIDDTEANVMPAQHYACERLDTPTGRLLIVSDEDRVRALDWEDCEARMQRLLRRHYGEVRLQHRKGRPASCAARALQAYFDGDLQATAALCVATNGTEFQCRVWAALRCIPAARTISYGALAAQIGHPGAARAVGLANGSNPIAIVVPCHRVIGSDQSLTGFGAGLARKRWLLDHETVSQIRVRLSVDTQERSRWQP